MAPLTRSRAEADGDAVRPGRAVLRAARRGGPDHLRGDRGVGGGQRRVPQHAGHVHRRAPGQWAEIADAVHEAGGRMFVQLWHVGRMGHPEISGVETVARRPSPPTCRRTRRRASSRCRCRGRCATDEIAGHRRRSSGRRPAAPSTPAWTAWRSTRANGYLLHEFLSDVDEPARPTPTAARRRTAPG